MSIRVLFWNIENYQDDPERTPEVVAHITESDPDVLGFSEIKDKAALRSILMNTLIDYDFGITDGKQGIELLAGWKREKFQQALFTQRREFKVANPNLRPGSLLSVKKDGTFYNMLFLHTDSGRKNKDYTNRQDMFERIWALKIKLEEISTEPEGARFLVLGDLNTMGRNASGDLPEITGVEEIDNLTHDADVNGMRLVEKSHSNTWARVNDDGTIQKESNLDHVLTSKNIDLEVLQNDKNVLVRGWVDAASDTERFEFVEGISDHSSVEYVIEG